MLSLFDFVYADKDAKFNTPFMKTFQCPEGSSTLNFPLLMGRRKATEMLMLDKLMTSEEALSCGFINGIVSVPANYEEGDFSFIPAVPKLLSYDLKTITNCK
mmetsp:Transcript_30505/g.22622  ORF Transcript_30505/g.22622 Transcript_30505/m.22622 type:complete len:102 (+) Transcript_30505:373-678(+)